jgi:hypothetical protein
MLNVVILIVLCSMLFMLYATILIVILNILTLSVEFWVSELSIIMPTVLGLECLVMLS